jgi:hypothetical protein
MYRLSVQLAIPMVEILDSTGEGLVFELHPTPLSGHERVLESNWGYGPFEIPLSIQRGASPHSYEDQASFAVSAL